jgi:hypothetical protein
MAGVALAVFCVPGAPCAGQPVTGDEPSNSDVVTSVFDIRSLLLEVPDYRAVFSDLRSDDLYGSQPPVPKDDDRYGRAPAEAEPAPEKQPDSQEVNAEVLMTMIQEIVVPESWREYGGDVGVMHYYGGQLVVSNRPEVVAEIERLLNLLKASRSLKLRLDACFVMVDSEAGHAEIGELRTQRGFSPDEFQSLLETHKRAVSVVRASVSGFEGQRIFTTAGQQYNVIVGADAVVAAGAFAHSPVTRQLNSGVTLEVQAVQDAARETVLADLRASLGKLTPVPQEAAPFADPFAVGASVPPYQVVHFATSVSLPMGRFSLVGVARYDDERDVMLFVMPSQE